jgi:hypothetical protein
MAPMHFHFNDKDITFGAPDDSRACKRTAPSDSDSSSSSSTSENESDCEAIPIRGVLIKLDQKLPDHRYLQYEAALKQKGILYAKSALDFDKGVFMQDIGMVEGSVGPFLHKVEKVIGEKEKAMAKKRKAKAKAKAKRKCA